MTEGEMVGWHHQLNGHESEQTQGASEGQSMGSQRVGPDLTTEQHWVNESHVFLTEDESEKILFFFFF